MSGKPLNQFIGLAQAADVTSAWIDISGETSFSIQADYGAINATITVECCVAQDMQPVALTDVTFTPPAGVAGSQLKNVTGAAFAFFRVIVDYTSGTGGIWIGGHAKAGG